MNGFTQKHKSQATVGICIRHLLLLVIASVFGYSEARGAELSDKGWTTKRWLSRPHSLPEQAADHEADGDFRKAAGIYGRMAKRATTDRTKAFALVRQADSLYAAKRFPKAYTAYRQSISDYLEHVPVSHVLERLISLGEIFTSEGGWFGKGGNRHLAIESLELVLETVPFSPQAPAVMLKLVKLQEAEKNLQEAVAQAEQLIVRFPSSEQSLEARRLAAKYYMSLAEGSDRDGAYVLHARTKLDSYMRLTSPEERSAETDELASRISEAQASRLLGIGHFYMRDPHARPLAARRYLHDVRRQFPGTDAAVEADAALARIELSAAIAKDLDIPATRSESVPLPDPDKQLRVRKRGTLQPENELKKFLLPLEDLDI